MEHKPRLTALLVVLLCGLAEVTGQGRSPAHRLLQPRYRDLPRPLLLPPAPEKKWDRYGLGFGSDGYLYDFVKRSSKRANRKYDYGFGSDGYLYDFVKK